jgi:hypothetical protein
MKNLVLLSFGLFAISALPVAAQAASWSDGVNAAISSGKFEEIDRIAAANPTALGEIGLVLLDKSKSLASSNPEKAALIFAAATPFVGQIPDGKVDTAIAAIKTLLDAAKGISGDQSSCVGASKVYSSALNMSSQPNVVAQSATLHDVALTDARSAVRSNSACGSQGLDDQVSLALQPNAPALAGLQGAVVPSGD